MNAEIRPLREVVYSSKGLAVLRANLLSISPQTLHKMMNPLCGQCLLSALKIRAHELRTAAAALREKYGREGQ